MICRRFLARYPLEGYLDSPRGEQGRAQPHHLALALSLAPDIQVNAVAPGLIDTLLTADREIERFVLVLCQVTQPTPHKTRSVQNAGALRQTGVAVSIIPCEISKWVTRKPLRASGIDKRPAPAARMARTPSLDGRFQNRSQTIFRILHGDAIRNDPIPAYICCPVRRQRSKAERDASRTLPKTAYLPRSELRLFDHHVGGGQKRSGS
jgi:hypothetical protein